MSTPAQKAPDILLDVGVNLRLEVGRACLTIRKFLTLAPGSIVELERAAGDSLDVYANNRLIARGEVVMVNDRYGVRFTEAIDASSAHRQ